MTTENLNHNLGNAKLAFGSGEAKGGLAHGRGMTLSGQIQGVLEALQHLRRYAPLPAEEDLDSDARHMAINTSVSHDAYQDAIGFLHAAAGEAPSHENLSSALQYGTVCLRLTSFTPEGTAPSDGGVPMRGIAEGLTELHQGLEVAIQAAERVATNLQLGLRNLEAASDISRMADGKITAYQVGAGLPTVYHPPVLHLSHIPNELPPF